jgi:hypothetical protein
MALEAGTRLGPYEIVAHAGAGGMGEIYRAKDTRLMNRVLISVSCLNDGQNRLQCQTEGDTKLQQDGPQMSTSTWPS